MGKAKKGGGKASAASAPKCTCDHPYNCQCGNRPPRPSKGHKWDPETQEWGGKGHKQKGASGQTATADKEAQTTEVGKTTIQTWQKLPSHILRDFATSKKKFLKPKFKALEDKPGKYKYRVILPDPKDSKKDLFFVPPSTVANEEQAKEEAALLALLHVTPELPHERKLPEPYKTTWLTAVAQRKSSDKKSKTQSNNDSADTATKKPPSGSGGAQASSNLMQGRVISQAQQQKKALDQRKSRNERIRRHEAIKMANRSPRVAMSARVRRALERILRGEQSLLEDDDDDAATLGEAETDAQGYVEDQLIKQGFTPMQARKSFQSTQQPPKTAAVAEDQWDAVYEECLQWLLLHVDEEDLPDGFDPTEGHLEVLADNDPASSKGVTGRVEAKRLNALVTSEARSFAERYGITPAEAALVWERRTSESPERTFWKMIVEKTQLADRTEPEGSLDPTECETLLDDEIEALQAIFDEGCQVITDETTRFTSVVLKMGDGAELSIQVKRGSYPSVLPEQVIVSSTAWAKANVGTALHFKIAEFLSTLLLEEAAIFQIHGHVVSLLEDSIADLEPMSLVVDNATVSSTSTRQQLADTKDQPAASVNGRRTSISKPIRQKTARRPRERSPFWSSPPTKTPPATAFPTLSQSLQRSRASLPAATARGEFVKLLQKAKSRGRVVLCSGETGCGKSTQIPQFILEENPASAKIVVCQPRRVAATGVAARVAEERGEPSAGVESVGYVVRGESAVSNKTRLLFCTTGVLLRQMQSENALDALTHIVLDEVHERSLDMDVLLALLKVTIPKYPNLTVVLMSATLDVDKFASYWGTDTPTIHIPGRTFPVKDYFLEDVLAFSRYMPPRKKGQSKSNSSGDATADTEDVNKREVNGVPIGDLVARVDESTVDYRLVSSLVKHIIINAKEKDDDGSILVFLPGAPEINKAIETVAREMSGVPLDLLPLHGGLQPREQAKVFKPAGKGRHKVIFSTNIAETSVTIPDCTSVIDCAREKQSSFDPSNRMPLLLETFCSKASLKQRRGRAGRVRPGTSYKLIAEATYRKLRQDTEPEILRSALDQTILSLLFLGIDCSPSGSFLPSLLDPPSPVSLRSAFDSLEAIGAVNDSRNQLTPLGMHIAGIPAPPIVGKILVIGSILGCREAGLAMGAGMSLGRSPLLRIDKFPRKFAEAEEDPVGAMKRQKTLVERKKAFETVGRSDHAYLAHIYLSWEGLRGPERRKYCETLGLSIPGMREMLQLKQQFDGALSSVGYRDSKDANKHGGYWRLIRAVAIAGMSPSQLVKIVRPAVSYQETAEGAKEKEGRAQELKFFVRMSRNSSTDNTRSNEERVFIHPSSENFSVGNFSCPWLVYNSLVRTSKPFLRDVTECNEYSLLLFGGDLEIHASKGTILIDKWCQLSASPKIGTLVGGIRNKLDELLTQKVSDPSLDIAATAEMQIISRLILRDGN